MESRRLGGDILDCKEMLKMRKKRYKSDVLPRRPRAHEERPKFSGRNYWRFTAVRLPLFGLASLLLCGALALSQTDQFQPNPVAGPGQVVIHSKFGGQIFGFDVDQNGTEGLLSEDKSLSNGSVLATVETFDQAK